MAIHRAFSHLLAASVLPFLFLPACQTVPPTTVANPTATPTTAPPTATSALSTQNSALGGTTLPALVLTPDALTALQQLSADDFTTRQEALAKLQATMAHHLQQNLLVQEVMLRIQQNLADQLQEMTGIPDLQAQAHVASLMEFDNALSRWALDALTLAEPQRKAMLAWGLAPENFPLIARAYSRKTETRAAAAKDLAKLNNDNAIHILGQLLDDHDREVSLTAMDALWDKTPTPAIIDALWDRSVAMAMQQFRPRPVNTKNINVHGRIVQVQDYDYNYYNIRMQDADVAVDVLNHMKSPLVATKLNELFTDFLNIKDANDYRWHLLSPNYGQGGLALSRLIDAYKPKTAVVFLVKSLRSNNNDGYNNQMNNIQYRLSSRIDSAALLLKITGQDPDDFKLKKTPNFGDRWVLEGTEKEEEAMIKKVEAWWKIHGNEYDPSVPVPTTNASTKPADTQAAKPAAAVPPPGLGGPGMQPAIFVQPMIVPQVPQQVFLDGDDGG